MEQMLRHNMAALEKGGESVINSIRGIDNDAVARVTVEDEQLASHNYDLMEGMQHKHNQQTNNKDNNAVAVANEWLTLCVLCRLCWFVSCVV